MNVFESTIMNRIPFNTGWTCRPAASEAEEVPVTIPHDAMQWDPKSADSPSGVNSGWYSARDYLYTKHFSSADIRRSSGDLTLLEFEGVYRNARIRLNGRLIASHDYGYSGFYADLSEYIAEGDNVLTVEAHNSDQPNCRWYSGTGIYRPVWLCVMPERHIMPDGVRITTVDYRTGRIAVDVRTSHPGVVYVSVLDVDGRSMAQFKALSDRLDGQGNLMHEECVIPDVRLWNTDEPNLYTCVVRFGDDEQREVFGVRTVECDARRGFRINGERVILRGCCLHHDNGLLGACAYPAAEERKVALLKGGGYNNPFRAQSLFQGVA